jgi:acetyltransferase
MSEIIESSVRRHQADSNIHILGDATWVALSARSIPSVQRGLDTRESSLSAFFSPRTIAVIGATDRLGSVGRAVTQNLLRGPLADCVFVINPNRVEVLGATSYRRLADVPKAIDLAIIVTPAASVPALIDECVQAHVRAAIVISAGFKEIGAAGVQLEEELIARARHGGLRLLGPNCLGLMNPHSGLNASFAAGSALPGSIAFLSQSGALCSAILDWSLRERIGFSAFVSVGSMADVDWADLLDHFAHDADTRAIAIYMESIGDARRFLSAARETAISKPVIVIKAGRTAEGAHAILAHTGTSSGDDAALDAAFRRVGIMRVDTIAEMFSMVDILARQPRPAGHRLCLVTNAGGPAVLAVDAHLRAGGSMAELSSATMHTLAVALPPEASRQNPVDVLGDASPERYADSVRVVLNDPQVDGLLAILTPQAMTDATATAECLVHAVKGTTKPVMAAWMGGQSLDAGKEVLHRAGIPTFTYPETAVRSFNLLARYGEAIAALYVTPERADPGAAPTADSKRAERIITSVRAAGRAHLTDAEAIELLTAYGITCARTRVASNAHDAVSCADEIGYPVALKIHSHSVAHMAADAGTVSDVRDPEQVRSAYHSIQQAAANQGGTEHFL